MTKRIFIAGLVASLAMAMLEMMYEGLFGAGLWAAPVFIAATILRGFQTVTIPVAFDAVPVVVGMTGHMMNSVILGFVFTLLFGRFLKNPVGGIIGGAVYALAIFMMMWFLVLPAIDPVMLKLNPYVFAMAHMVWGAVLGGMVAKKTA